MRPSRSRSSVARDFFAGSCRPFPGGHQLRVRGVQRLDPVRPRGHPVRQLSGIRVARPDEVAADVRPAVKVHQPVRFLPGGLADGVAVNRLCDGDVAAVGTALRAGWEAKRRLASGVSDARIDAAVSRALGRERWKRR